MSELKDEVVIDERETRTYRVLELAKQGLPYREIADLVGLTRQRVSQICLEHGIVRRPNDINVENWERYWEKNEPDRAIPEN